MILVALGGFFGSMLRFYIAEKCQGRLFGTWLANITGTLLLAITFRCYIAGYIGKDEWLLLGVGFAGAYTTFSTFGKETIQLMMEQQILKAIFYVFASFAVALLLVWICLTV